MPLPLSPSPLPAASLRLACALAIATTLAACQTSTISANTLSTAQKPVIQNTLGKDGLNTAKSGQDIQPSSALTMDMSGRHEYQLENGLKVVVKEDHRAPVVMTQIWYRVGSADEPAG